MTKISVQSNGLSNEEICELLRFLDENRDKLVVRLGARDGAVGEKFTGEDLSEVIGTTISTVNEKQPHVQFNVHFDVVFTDQAPMTKFMLKFGTSIIKA